MHVSRPTRGHRCRTPVRGCHPLRPAFPDGSGLSTRATGLVRVRSPLLTESRLMSFPPGTEMFQFPGFAPPAYGFSGRYPCKHGWVAPFGDPRDQSLLAAPPGLSQRATSFIASWRQGIHQMPLLSLNPPSGNRAPPGESKRQRTTNTHHKARIPMPNCPRPANGKTKKKGAGEPCQHPSAHDPRQPPEGNRAPAERAPSSPPHDVQRARPRRATGKTGGGRGHEGPPRAARRTRPRARAPRQGGRAWWAWADLNGRPHAYQACALTS